MPAIRTRAGAHPLPNPVVGKAQPVTRQAWTGWRVRRRDVTCAIYVLFDGIVVSGGFALALMLRFGGRVPAVYAARLPVVAVALATVYIGANLQLGIYRRWWRYAGVDDALALARAAVISTGLALVADAALVPADHPLPISVLPIGGLLALLGMGLGRVWRRLFKELALRRSGSPAQRVLILGAGDTGQRLVYELQSNPTLGYRPACFVDDDPDKQGERIHGVRVSGTRHDVPRLVREQRIDVIVLAIPSLPAEAQRTLLGCCDETTARIKIMPSLPALLNGQHNTVPFRDARLEDLLGRPPVVFADGARPRALTGSILITGAAGSIGSELAHQAARGGAEQLILLDTNESGLFDLAAELELVSSDRRLRPEIVVVDVTNARRVAAVFERYRPTTVFHAAAYKHVPLMEAHPGEAVVTNVVGTCNVCLAAEQGGCERVVLISTDKAVAPVNVMGASKRLGELIIEALADGSRTTFCAVRFGNVLGSRGSVVPTFARQIRQGGPVTITHPEVTRFFMTVSEAANLIIESSRYAQGGEIFMLDMGAPVRILDLAQKLIRLHGLRPGEDIEIRQIGLRPGEKLHEVLTSPEELVMPTPHPRVRRVRGIDAAPLSRAQLLRTIAQLQCLAEGGATDALVAALFEAIGVRSDNGVNGGALQASDHGGMDGSGVSLRTEDRSGHAWIESGVSGWGEPC
jgi:FlaA1/EpsC-like NDP-sugar epimerase